MVYGPKDLEQAKRLFLDPSEKVIKQIIEKERYNLRKRDKSRRLLSTWRDDDSETYQLSKKRKSRKMKRKNNPATVDEVGTAKKRCKSLTSGVAIKAETEVEPEVETVADEEVETISEEFLDSLPLLEESDALAGELDGTVADKTNGTGQETDEIDIDESEQQSLEEGPLKEKQASVQGFGGDESRESHSPEKQDGLEEASPGLQHTIAQIVHPDNVEEPEVEPDSKHGENVADEKPEGSPAQLDGQHDGETKDDFDGKLRETLNFDIEEDSTIHGCLEECDISGTLAMNEVPTVKNSEGSSAEGKSLVKDQQGSSELRDAVPIQQQLDYSQDAEEGADVPKVEEMVEAQPKTDIGPLLDVVFEALDTTKTNTAYTALPVGQNDESFKDDPTPKPAESCPWCEDFAYGIIGLGSHPVERMCVRCRQARISITSCPGHLIMSHGGLNPELFDFKAAYNSLAPIPGVRLQRNAWCSLCPTPAFFRCATQPSATGQANPPEPMVPGCGLLLCETCHILLRSYKDLARVVALNREEDPQDGCRADVGYLLPGSDLYKQIKQSNQVH